LKAPLDGLVSEILDFAGAMYLTAGPTVTGFILFRRDIKDDDEGP
jgi:hypothetical protein